MQLEEFLQLGSPEKYDFKNEGANKLYSSLENNIEKFLLYKSSGCIGSKYFPEMDLFIKEDKRVFGLREIDCDTSLLVKEIYNKLWESAIKDQGNSTISGEYGDTMTSFQRLFNIFVEEKIETKLQKEYREKYFPKQKVTKVYILHLYYSCKSFIEECNKCDAVHQFAKSVHQIGNFIPVPKGFNRSRAQHDSWDLTLSKIREWYLESDEKKRDKILGTLLCSKLNAINECKKWLNWCAVDKEKDQAWEKFIEVNYLQEFVNQDDMKPIMFCENHSWDSKLSGDDVAQVCNTCNELIELRGVRMINELKRLQKINEQRGKE